MVTRKEDTPQRRANRKYEEQNKEKRKAKSGNFQTMIPRELLIVGILRVGTATPNPNEYGRCSFRQFFCKPRLHYFGADLIHTVTAYRCGNLM